MLSNVVILRITKYISALAILLTFSHPVQAQTNNNWKYISDSAKDGVDGAKVGGTPYEIYGLGIKTDLSTNRLVFGVNSNLPLAGKAISGGRSITYGDLFLDFNPSGTFKSANQTSSLFGIRFAGTNESGVSSLGLFSNVTGKNVAKENSGFANLGTHNKRVVDKTKTNSTLGELAWNDPYYTGYTTGANWKKPETLLPNVIKTGNKISDVTLLDQVALTNLGFNTSNFDGTGSQTFGFSIALDHLPTGDFLATLMLECNNDGIAGYGKITVPESSPVIPLTLVGMILFSAQIYRLKRKPKLA